MESETPWVRKSMVSDLYTVNQILLGLKSAGLTQVGIKHPRSQILGLLDPEELGCAEPHTRFTFLCANN
jgi:hypothetical protein